MVLPPLDELALLDELEDELLEALDDELEEELEDDELDDDELEEDELADELLDEPVHCTPPLPHCELQVFSPIQLWLFS